MQNLYEIELRRLIRYRKKIDKEIDECFEELLRLISQLNIKPLTELLISSFSSKFKQNYLEERNISNKFLLQ
jgi:hypothetical protein